MKKKYAALFILCCLISLLALPVHNVKASTVLMPEASYNLSVGLRNRSRLVATDNGYMRVFYNGEKIGIEYYDNDFHIQSEKSLAMELKLWGGFYAGVDAYYIVEGQTNEEENDRAEVIRVLKYDMDWNKIGTASITGDPELFGGEVRYPFIRGCVEMEEANGILYIVTGHEGYVDPEYNQGHQGLLMIAVDEAAMTGQIISSNLSHSFAQYIACKDSNLYLLEQNEGFRCTALNKIDMEKSESTAVVSLKYGGVRDSARAIECYASVDGMALSSDHVLCLGTSIDQSKYDSVSAQTAHNIYLTVTPMADFSQETTSTKWLTDYTGKGKCFLGTKITKINDNRFMISWEETGSDEPKNVSDDFDDTLSANTLHYIFIDGGGNPISQQFTAPAPISECQPIVKDGKIVYYASNETMVNFYSIDAQTGKFSKKIQRVAGENATWKLKNGVLTISGTGPISADPKAKQRVPVSSTTGNYVISDSAWKVIKGKVKKIVIKSGITSIPSNEFQYFSNLKEVVLESGVISIGKEAFADCGEALKKITIPSSVTSIGEGFLWSGYGVPSGDEFVNVVLASVYAPSDSYAIKYAKKHDIPYYYSDAVDLSKAKVSGLKKSYTYTGNFLQPKITVKLNGKTLKSGKDYTVSYDNNFEPGKATIEIKGISKYKGTIKKTFKIKKAKPKTYYYFYS